MTTNLKQLRKLSKIDKVIIHSLDGSLYQVSVLVDGQEHYVENDDGKLLRSHHKLGLQTLFAELPVERTVLRHKSAYDEMIGLPVSQGDNFLEVSLGNSEIGH